MLSLGLMQRLNVMRPIPGLLPGCEVDLPQALLLLQGISGQSAGRPLCKVKKGFPHLPDNISAFPGVLGKCQGCSKGLSPPGEGRTRHCRLRDKTDSGSECGGRGRLRKGAVCSVVR